MRNGNQDIYGYSLHDSQEFQITTDTSDQRHSKIYFDTVVWHDRRDGDYNIYAAILDPSVVGGITGKVTYEGTGVADVTIELHSQSSGLVDSVTTSFSGSYVFNVDPVFKGHVKIIPPEGFNVIGDEMVQVTFDGSERVEVNFELIVAAAVGGYLVEVNKFSMLTPYLALAGLIVAVSTIYIIKKRKD
jgi:beta propeller repeat protein